MIGIIGIGTMGFLVLERLLDAGETAIVADTAPAALARAVERGAVVADGLSDVAQQAAIILLILPGPPQVEAVVAGLLPAIRPHHIVVDLSTSDPATTRRIGEQLRLRGADCLDAPILGRPAAVGRWVLPVGGRAATLARVRPVLATFAREVNHVGELGAGHTLKLLNALMFSAINAMTAEMLAIAQKSNLDPAVLYSTIAGSDAATVSGLFRETGRKIVERDFAPTFSIDLLCKDNGLAVQMARDLGAPPIVAAVVQTMNELARAQGRGHEDTAALVKTYEQLLAKTEPPLAAE